jgi:hypothetical protein
MLDFSTYVCIGVLFRMNLAANYRRQLKNSALSLSLVLGNWTQVFLSKHSTTWTMRQSLVFVFVFSTGVLLTFALTGLEPRLSYLSQLNIWDYMCEPPWILNCLYFISLNLKFWYPAQSQINFPGLAHSLLSVFGSVLFF